MLKKILKPIILILLYLVWGTLTWGEHTIMLILMFLSAFVITFIYSKNSKNIKLDLMLINLPFLLLIFLTCLIGKDFSRALLYLLFTPLYSFLGYLYNSNKKILVPILSVIFAYFIGFYLQPNYFSFYSNSDSETNQRFPNVTIVDKNMNKIKLDNNIVILDFWSTTCGICFKKFPELENTYLKYKDNQKVKIYSLNVPLRTDKFENTVKILDSIGYKFPKLYAESAKEIRDSLKINSFPHLIILKNNRIRYSGMLETNKNVIIYSVESQIEKLLKEE